MLISESEIDTPVSGVLFIIPLHARMWAMDKDMRRFMKKEKSTGFRRAIGNILFLVKPWLRYGKTLSLIFLFSAIIAYPVRSIATVTIAQAILEAAQSGRGYGYVIGVAALYIAVIAACWTVREGREELYRRWKTIHIEAQIEREIYEQSMRTDFKYIDDPGYFDSYKMATEEYVSRSGALFDTTFQILGESMSGLAVLGVMSMTEPVIVPFVLAGVILSAISRAKYNVVQNKIWRDTTTQRRRMNYLTRLLYVKSANAELRSTNVRNHLFRRYDAARDERVNTVRNVRVRQFFYRMLSRMADDIATYIALIYVAIGFVSGRIDSIGIFTTLIAASSQLSANLNTVSYFITDLMNNSMYAEKVRGFFELKSEIEPSSGGMDAPAGPLSLELCDVTFAYPNSRFALHGVSISVKAGEKIAIVGENGAGKTTLSKLLLRLYDVSGGAILYNGQPLGTYDIHKLRRRIGVAFQEPQLYALSVRDNMRAYADADDEALDGILKTVGLNLSLDGEVTREFAEDGVMLSGGQAQKLGLSRLLHGDFGLLLLDEPSSALDPLAEYEMTKLMFAESRTTTIMVAHRLSTIRDADRIYLIDDGAVAEAGTHDELMALRGRYADMFTKQAENYLSRV
jgi:ATP-binding cassette subfamily B protein